MTWNYRIIYHTPEQEGQDGWFALHEVYYNKKGKSDSWTENAISFVCDEYEGPDGIRKSLAMALADAVRLPVLMIRDGKLVEHK